MRLVQSRLGDGAMSEPTHDALEELRAKLARYGSEIDRGSIREIDGTPWVLCTPELMLGLIERAESALAAERTARETAERMLRLAFNESEPYTGNFSTGIVQIPLTDAGFAQWFAGLRRRAAGEGT